MNEAQERMGQAIDSLDNLCHALNLNMTAEFHVNQLKQELPSVIEDLKEAYVDMTGENPWE